MKARDSNLELLRLISMFMIILIHANMFLGRFCPDPLPRTFFNGMVNGICNIGVTCFILISGYFGIRLKLNKLIKLECMMITFSLLETALLYLVFPEQMQGAALLEALIKSLFPVISRKYWFYSCYVVLTLLSKWLQILIEHLEEKVFRHLLFLLLVLFSVLPTVFYFEILPDNGKGLGQMIMIYLLGRYIALYRRRLPFAKINAAVLFVFLWLLNGLSHEMPLRIGGIYHHLCKDNSITNIIMAILLFYFMKDLKITLKPLNRVTTHLFAVFALNNSLVNIFMYFFAPEDRLIMNNSGGGFLLLAAMALMILIICLLIGFLRELLFGWPDRKISEAAGRLGIKMEKLLK